MPKLSQFDNTQPILNPIQVTSNAQGKQALAGAFGEIANEEAKQVTRLGENESQAMYLASTTDASRLKSQAQTSIMQNPDPTNVNQVLQDYRAQMDGVLKGSVVNSGDRMRLKATFTDDVDQMNTMGVRNNIEQARRQSAIKFNTETPQLFTTIQQNLISNPEQATKDIDYLKNTAEGLLKSGVISQDAYQNTVDTAKTLVDRHTQLMSMTQSGEMTAQDYHKAMAFTGVQNTTGAPVDENAKFLHVSLNSDTNYQDAIAGLQRGELNWNAVASMSKDEYQKYMLSAGGVAEAKGYINSGKSYAQIQNRYDFLNGAKGTLTVAEQAERDQLGKFNNDLKQDYIGTMSQTPMGQQISQDFKQNISAIKNSPTDPNSQSQQYHDAYNKYVSQMINLGKTHGIPADVIKPVPQEVVAQAQGGFGLGADPGMVTEALHNNNQQNGSYLAASVTKGNQQEVVQAANLLRTNGSKPFVNDLIAANQDGRDYSGLNIGKEGLSDSTIRAKIATKLNDTLGYISAQPEGQERNSSFMQAATNYVKYQALKHNDLSVSNLNDYIGQFNEQMKGAYNIASGSHYDINTAELNISKNDAGMLANYVIKKAGESLYAGRSASEIIAAQDANPLTVTYSPSGNMLVYDATGQLRYSQPYTTTMLDAAKHDLTVIKKMAQDNTRFVVPGPGVFGGQ